MWRTNFDQLSPTDILSAQRPRDRSEMKSQVTASSEDIPDRPKGRAPAAPISVSPQQMGRCSGGG